MNFRPQTPIRLSVPSAGQHDAGECLAACVAMVCAYLGIPTDYNQLLKLLDIEKGIGAPFSRILAAESLGVSVVYEQKGTLEELYALLTAGWPIITSIDTGELPYWQGISSRHVLVVVGMDQEDIYVNDPEFPGATLRVHLGDFDLAWLAQEEQYAVLATR